MNDGDHNLENVTWAANREATRIQIANLQFGLELELLTRVSLTTEKVVQILTNKHIPARAAVYSGNNYDVWQIKPDGSLRPPAGGFSFELVSPILKGENGCTELRKVLEVLTDSIPSLHINESCGLHIHIDMKDAPLVALKAVCQNLLKFESALDLLLHPSRHNNRYIKSNRAAHIALKNEELFNKIKSCTTPQEIVDVMNPNRDRYFKFNLQRLQGIGTIEIRVHQGTTKFEEVKNWAKLMIRLFTFSTERPPKDCLRDNRTAAFALHFMFLRVIQREHLTKYYAKVAIDRNPTNRELVAEFSDVINELEETRERRRDEISTQHDHEEILSQLQVALGSSTSSRQNVSIVYRLYPYSMESNGAKALSQKLDGKLLRRDSRIPQSRNLCIINWGLGIMPTWWNNQLPLVLNHPQQVRRCYNKITTFELLKQAGVSIPYYATNINTAQTWMQTSIVVGRKTVTGSQGDGIVFYPVGGGSRMEVYPLYTKYIEAVAEYRVHVIKEHDGYKAFHHQKKKKVGGGAEGPHPLIRNRANGYVFVTQGYVLPEDTRVQSALALSALGLDFGAVDVVVEASGRSYVLEVNSAPGLMEPTLSKYAEAFKKVAQHRFEGH